MLKIQFFEKLSQFLLKMETIITNHILEKKESVLSKLDINVSDAIRILDFETKYSKIRDKYMDCLKKNEILTKESGKIPSLTQELEDVKFWNEFCKKNEPNKNIDILEEEMLTDEIKKIKNYAKNVESWDRNKVLCFCDSLKLLSKDAFNKAIVNSEEMREYYSKYGVKYSTMSSYSVSNHGYCLFCSVDYE